MVSKKYETEDEVTLPEVEHLTYEEALAMLDASARYYLNMSGEEFLRRWKEDDFEDPDSIGVTHVGIWAPLFIEE